MAQPRAYTPNHLVEKILASRSALVGERKQVTVLFADVQESMRLAARVDAEEWHRILDRFFAILADGVHRFEGTINQFTGDGIMALFGAPLAHEDHAQRACHAALHLREQVRLYAQELRRARRLAFAVRMGLNSGEVIVGAIGDDLRMDYTAQGHSVGLAARMQQIATPGGIYLTGSTAALVAGFFDLTEVGRIRVKGVRRAVPTFALVGVGAARTRLQASRARGFSGFVGRADEVATLEAALSRALAGNGQVVRVVGAPGVGKSRLCREVLDRWRAEGLRIAEAHCPAHGRSLPYSALHDLLRSLLGIVPGEGLAISRRRVATRLRRLHRALVEELPLVLDAIGLAYAKRPPPPLDPDARRERLFTFACRLVQTQSGREPVVLSVDDVQWIDAESNAFLARLVDAVGWTRTLLLLNSRPDYVATWATVPYYRQMELGPLGADAAATLLQELVGDTSELHAACALIETRAEGNPFFIEEIVQSLVDQGVLVRRRGPGPRMRLARPLDGIGIPATVQALLAARIDGLSEPAKAVLQTAAVIGREFSAPVLRLTLERDTPAACTVADVEPALRTLEQLDLVRPEHGSPPARHRFKHPLTHEVAYHSQLSETRLRRHGAVARALEHEHADRLGEYAALLAHHWDAAGQPYASRVWRRRAALRVTSIQVRRGRPRPS